MSEIRLISGEKEGMKNITMAKLVNVFAYFIAQIFALALTYLFWGPATGFVGEMDGFFKPIASITLMMMLILGNIIGPILVLNDEKLVERFRPE